MVYLRSIPQEKTKNHYFICFSLYSSADATINHEGLTTTEIGSKIFGVYCLHDTQEEFLGPSPNKQGEIFLKKASAVSFEGTV